jgi:hypothetical protein
MGKETGLCSASPGNAQADGFFLEKESLVGSPLALFKLKNVFIPVAICVFYGFCFGHSAVARINRPGDRRR